MSTLVHRFGSGAEVRRFPSGRLVNILDGRVTVLTDEEAEQIDDAIAYDWEAGRTCSLCDGLGHGYPGGGPCPLEERGHWDAEADLQRYGAY